MCLVVSMTAVLQNALFSLADGTAAEDSKTGLAFHHHDADFCWQASTPIVPA